MQLIPNQKNELAHGLAHCLVQHAGLNNRPLTVKRSIDIPASQIFRIVHSDFLLSYSSVLNLQTHDKIFGARVGRIIRRGDDRVPDRGTTANESVQVPHARDLEVGVILQQGQPE